MSNVTDTEAGPGSDPEGLAPGDEPAIARGGDRLGRFSAWARRVNFERKLALVLLVAAVTAGLATFAAMTGRLPQESDPTLILLLLNLDLILLLALGALIARRLVVLRIANKRGAAGARLHTRLVALFSLVAATPTIIIATFSVIFFDFSLQGWFSERVSTAVKESMAVAEAYLEEHRHTITADALAMAQDLNRQGQLLLYNPTRFNQLVEAQSAIRSLTEAIVIDGSGRILARAGYSLLLEFDPQIPDWAMQRAKTGEVVLLTANTEDRVRALLRLDAFTNSYLFVGRLIDPRVLAHMDRTRGAVQLYEDLEGERSGLQITFALIFLLVALLLLLTAVWIGLAVANYLARPIGDLVLATERVRGGDLSVRVDESRAQDEIGPLSRAFNRMTGELERQQRELLEANRQLDDRRRFIEAVLSGVSAGVVGLDREGRIELPNRKAGELLSAKLREMEGRQLEALLPETDELIAQARQRPGRVIERQLSLEPLAGGMRTLLARVVAEQDDEGIVGFVVTFDDITELLSAQRKAAWADVARRIAHEIKNPLTPIQLSAERLRRKYLGEIKSDPSTFEVCTDTIVRQVADIGRMVDEFSSFARMPAPIMADEDLRRLVTEALVLQQSAHSGIAFDCGLPECAVVVTCDRQQINQALTNLLQNAIDAIEGREAANGETLPPGEVRVRLESEAGQVSVVVEDNGRGLPRRERHRLTEPYVTTRERGTGLGLAIVRKIMEDHGGELRLEDRNEGGARVSLIFVLRHETAVAPATVSREERERSAAREEALERDGAAAHGQ